MKLPIGIVVGLLLTGGFAGCGSAQTDTAVMDFRRTSGAYILVYSTDTELRAMFENRLAADLATRDIRAVPSHPDLPDVTTGNRNDLLTAAQSHQAMFILVIEEVGHHETGTVPDSGRITHDHPTLLEFYEHTRPANHAHEDDTQVFVEVSAFLVQESRAKLVWSGAAWSFRADGEAGRISGLSTTIADAIDQARRAYLGADA